MSQIARSDPTRRRRQSCLSVAGVRDSLYLDAGILDFEAVFEAQPARAILLSHFHADHVLGLIRLSYSLGKKVPVFAPENTSGYGHLIENPGILDFRFKPILEPFECGEFLVTPIPLQHNVPTHGYCVENRDCRLAYLCDTKGLSERCLMYLIGWRPEVLIVDATEGLAKVEDSHHNSVEEAIRLAAQIRPKISVLSHIGLGAEIWLESHRSELPENMIVASDGLELTYTRSRDERIISRFFF
ncbi:MAG: MBL fold metallo-hydrolase [Puniceicoccaceae bacterium]